MKMNKIRLNKSVIISTLLTLLPILLGVALYDKLPDIIATHWGMDGQADGWSSKPFAVFGLPLLMAVINIVCCLGTAADPRNDRVSEKMMAIVRWIVPAICLVVYPITIFTALGYSFDIGRIVSVLIGVLFVALGNYLPKCRQNSTVGIRVPWTLNNEENWDKTHRLGGVCFIISGVLMVISGWARMLWLLFAAIAIAAVVPIVYSGILHRRGL